MNKIFRNSTTLIVIFIALIFDLLVKYCFCAKTEGHSMSKIKSLNLVMTIIFKYIRITCLIEYNCIWIAI